jgi:dipeptidyl aminopeptidase
MLILVDGKQWRHSGFSNYYIHSLDDHSTIPLAPPSNPPRIAYATWSPVGSSIAYVAENDIYLVRDAKCATVLSIVQTCIEALSSVEHLYRLLE